MNPFRFTIANLLAATFIVGVITASITTAHPVLSLIVTNLIWCVLFGAILGACYRPTQEQRAFWAGFAMFGWGFFLLHSPLLSPYFGISTPMSLVVELLTDEVRAAQIYQVGRAISVVAFAIAGGVVNVLLIRGRVVEE